MSELQDLPIPTIEDRLGYVFRKKELLEFAFTHRSYLNENRSSKLENNERLEFLGDSVLGFIVSEFLYREYPHLPEGDLSFLRSKIVEAHTCFMYLKKLGVGDFLRLGKGERMNEGKGRESILADLFEAILGAIFLDSGMKETRKIVLRIFEEDIRALIQSPPRNWKALLQEYLQKHHQQAPVYKVLSEDGPDHSKIFVVAVYFADTLLGQGEGSSKKQAEQKAAEEGCRHFSIQ